MNQSSLSRIEFEKVLDLLKRNIKTAPGILALNLLTPSLDAVKTNHEFLLIKETAEYLKFDGSLSFEETLPLDEPLKNAQIEGYILDTEDVFVIKKTIELWVSNRDSILPYSDKYSNLGLILHEIHVPDSLLKKLSKIIDQDGKILDSASDELRKIRKRKNSIRGDIQAKLNSVMDGGRLGDSLKDRIVTIRDGRFVIPVRSQSKNKLRQEMQFIIHSFSGSGETAFVEPQEVVHLNNEMVEIDELEWEEIRRILRDITIDIAQESKDIQLCIYALGRLELLYARAKFANEYKCGYPIIIPEKSILELKNARHPLLGQKCVPIDLEIGKTCQGIIISGPNAGGKTVAIKTAGLMIAMALSGIPITADSDSKIGIFDQILVEIGDEQNLSENLSSFSGHILSIANILKTCGPQSLVLIDEIASSTEPKEGEAIGREISRAILDKGSKFIITTHFQGLKELAYSDDRIKNAYVEFDEEKLIPLYRLITGGSGQSYALKVAKKYGMPQDVIFKAEEYLKTQASDVEMILKNAEEERSRLFKKKTILERHISEAREIKKFYDSMLKDLEAEKKSAQKKSVSTLQSELDLALKELAEIRDNMKKNRIGDIKSTENSLRKIKKILDDTEQATVKNERKKVREWKPGQRVYLASYRKEGIIEEVGENRVKVRVGILSVMAEIGDLYQSEKEQEEKLSRVQVTAPLSSAPYSIDLRGMLGEDALKTVEKAVENALISGSSVLSIIHGKGEGVLRKVVWDYLKSCRSIRSYSYAKPEEGGQGKTIVYFK